jgi:hypothetical protein
MASGQIMGKVINMIVDTGGARTMVDKTVARELGLPIERATRRRKFGSYWGPGGKETYYWGRIPGPIEIRLSDKVKYKFNEIKIIEHCEPIFLVGTDTLVDDEASDWRFCWVGLHPVKRVGQWVFVNNKTGELEYIQMATWPLPVDQQGRRINPVD